MGARGARAARFARPNRGTRAPHRRNVRSTQSSEAAGADVSELNELQRRLQDYRFSGQAKFIATIANEHSLRPGVTVEEAAATFSALASPELHHILTADRGWSQERYARWLERTALATLLEG
jgi:hypothetical protein